MMKQPGRRLIAGALLAILAHTTLASQDDRPVIQRVTASAAQSENPAWQAVDGVPETRWAAEGVGQSLRVDLSGPVEIERIAIRFYEGSKRRYRFRASVTGDGETWQVVFDGESQLGEVQPVTFPLATVVALEIVGSGNSANAWNSIYEIDIPGIDAERTAARLRAEPPMSSRVPEAWRASWFAIEPQVASPVAVSVANDGSVYVTRTSRRKLANLDIRNNRDWLHEQLAFRTVEDKEAFYRRVLTPEASAENVRRVPDHNGDGLHDWRDLTGPTEQLLRLVDLDGDGRADSSNVFADEFRTLITGVAGGVLAHRGDVYATVSPSMWKLTDRDGDGRSDTRESLARGFSVHVSFAGHNMHGLTAGPDGRIYWSIGDIGSSPVDRDGRRHPYPDEGAVFRCWPDGSGFEVFARGLRNPQELAFDDRGNLFTGENDSDLGDRERWIYLVDGADYGWRNYWQYQSGEWGAPTGDYHLWMEERLWEPAFPEQAAFMVPAIANIGPGPCGLTYYPGTGLGPEYEDNFFLALFTGSPANSRVDRFKLEPEGAGFRVAESEPVITNVLATGLDFGPDSALYVADWVGGWDVSERGRIIRIVDSVVSRDAVVTETRRLLASLGSDRASTELADLLGHPNQKVRLGAQWELVERGERSLLANVAGDRNRESRARWHGLWGLWQMARTDPRAIDDVLLHVQDEVDEVRAQALRVLGDVADDRAFEPALRGLEDPSARVQYFAARALGRIGDAVAFEPIVEWISATASDRFLRHAGIVALSRIASDSALARLRRHASREVRLAAVVALRRLESSKVKRFLDDADQWVVIEAARAIHDVPIEAARPALARLVSRTDLRHPWLLRRVLTSAFRLGGSENANALADVATEKETEEALRLEALAMLADWAAPSARDRVLGRWYPLVPETRDPKPAAEALANRLPELLASGGRLQQAAVEAATALGVAIDSEVLLETVQAHDRLPETRAAALRLLEPRGDDSFPVARTAALASDSPLLKVTAVEIWSRQEPEAALRFLESWLESGGAADRQSAFTWLARDPWPAALPLVRSWADRLTRGDVSADLRLDVVEAARAFEDAELARALSRHESASTLPEKLAPFGDSLVGGDFERGRRIFHFKVETECLRCHQAGGPEGDRGGNVAPNLAKLGDRQTREQILESIVMPNARLAEGYEFVLCVTEDGLYHTGRVLSETETHLVLEPTDGPLGPDGRPRPLTLAKSEIEDRSVALSPMPINQAEHLTPREMRDLIEFLFKQ